MSSASNGSGHPIVNPLDCYQPPSDDRPYIPHHALELAFIGQRAAKGKPGPDVANISTRDWDDTMQAPLDVNPDIGSVGSTALA